MLRHALRRLVPPGLLLLCALPAQAQTTALFIDRPLSTAPITRQADTFTEAGSQFRIARNFDDGISMTVEPLDGSPFVWLELSASDDTPIATGEYLHATRWPFTQFAGLSLTVGSRGCNVVTGRFVVHEVVYAVDGTVLRFAADVEHHCEDALVATFAAFRYNSTFADLRPFGGEYPQFALAVTPSDHGTVTGGGLACGPDSASCSIDFSDSTTVSLTATPDAGYIFTGWTGGCRGGETIVLNVNSIKRCGATFEAAVTGTPRTLLVAEREATPFRPREQHVYSANNSSWNVTSYGSQVELTIVSIGSQRDETWEIRLVAPVGQTLAVGSYGPVSWPAWELTAGLSVYTGDIVCGQTGRFIIHELERTATGEVLRLATDIERHCDDDTEGMFIAVRFNSLFPSTRPFDGNYPRYALTLTAPEHGTITGPGLSCGAGQTQCEQDFADATSITLTANAEPGHVFAGWTGFCNGEPTTTVHINTVKHCGATFQPQQPDGPRSLLVIESMPGEYVGQGRRYVYSPENSAWSFNAVVDRRYVQLRVRTAAFEQWVIRLSAPSGQTLAAGQFSPAFREHYTSVAASIEVSAFGRTCNELTGRFVVHEIEIVAGQVVRLAADIEQHCENLVPALFAAIRYNSVFPDSRPFGGNYPRYELTVATPANGTVSGGGIDCGGGRTLCALGFDAARTLTLTATPEVGYIFTGWTGNCSGGETTTVSVNSVRSCGATFSPVRDAPRTLLVWTAHTGHRFGSGRREVYSPANSHWTAHVYGGGREVSISVGTRSGERDIRWDLTFRAAEGETLQRGVYPVARFTYPRTSPELSISGDGPFCWAVGSFVIRELVMDVDSGTVSAFAVDFEHHCDRPDSAPLYGSLHYQSTGPIVEYRSRHDLNGDGRLDLWWRHQTEGWLAAWYMDGLSLLDAQLASPSRVSNAWQIVGTADFNADGSADLLWQHLPTGMLTVWYMSGRYFVAAGLLTPNAASDPDWQVHAVGDLNQDSRPDLIWQHRTLGYLAVWIMDGVTLVEARLLTPSRVSDLGWRIIGTGDFNADGVTDLFWRHQQSGLMTVWYMNGTAFSGSGLVTPSVVTDQNWEIGAISDINDDGQPDLVWQHRQTGRLSVWIMQGVTLLQGAGMQPPQVGDPNWRLAGPRQ